MWKRDEGVEVRGAPRVAEDAVCGRDPASAAGVPARSAPARMADSLLLKPTQAA